jgi:hypothetical protein
MVGNDSIAETGKDEDKSGMDLSFLSSSTYGGIKDEVSA